MTARELCVSCSGYKLVRCENFDHCGSGGRPECPIVPLLEAFEKESKKEAWAVLLSAQEDFRRLNYSAHMVRSMAEKAFEVYLEEHSRLGKNLDAQLEKLRRTW